VGDLSLVGEPGENVVNECDARGEPGHVSDVILDVRLAGQASQIFR
jgi:hypothetical protein